ncbi:hypothetical protein [uncultured Agrobacterium sp.]|uniref:hypothetical protein n=1 Tax=uncultured Agrobacterium sp. TaxID=157277 RepID=UPI0025EBCEEA|nr:hypothetical protein [uncultured Agrobacterium sp.]
MKKIVKYCSVAGFTAALSAASIDSQAQVYVNQANPGIGSVYLNQIPSGAMPRPPVANKPAKRAIAGRSPASVATVVASGTISQKNLHFPNVGSGSSAIVHSNTAEWPSVGRGAVNR